MWGGCEASFYFIVLCFHFGLGVKPFINILPAPVTCMWSFSKKNLCVVFFCLIRVQRKSF